MSQKNNDNRSLFMYTALIFFVAIVMIVMSFFAQTHLEQMRVSEKDAENVSLSNKAAQVSEENMQLVELNKTLRMKNEEKENQIVVLTTERDMLVRQKNACNSLMAVYDMLLRDDKNGARERLQGIYTEDLSPEQKEIYDKLVKEAK